MRRNVDLTRGLVMSEALMMGLGAYIGREYAHDLVYDLCRESIRSGVPLIDLVAKNAEIARHADRVALERMMDPSNYLGQAGPMIDRVLATHTPNS
jgi:3-carboxy-cis,cis-muconate cycloisomerase